MPAEDAAYITAQCAEVDLLLELPGGERWAIEIKLGSAPKAGKGFHHAREDIHPTRSFIVYSGHDRYPITPEIEAIGVAALARELTDAR